MCSVVTKLLRKYIYVTCRIMQQASSRIFDIGVDLSFLRACNFQQAYTNIMTAENYKPKGLFIEKAKLLWAKVEPEGALNTLKRGIEHHFPEAATFKSMPQDTRREDRGLCAEAKLLIATYNDENVNVDMNLNLGNYKEAVEVCRDWEKSIVCLAQYKYRVLRTIGDNNENNSRNLDSQVYMINYFGKSLHYGCEYIYQSMPRMLSIWLDFGTRLAQDIKPGCNMAILSERLNALTRMSSLIETFMERLPAYMFMTAFSQIISRICHPHKDCYRVLKMIIVKIIVAYPQQALWMFISVYKSPYVVRVKRCEEVLRSSEILENSSLTRMINDFRELVDRLIELCHKPVKGRGGIKVSIKTLVPSLYRLVSNRSFSPILIPLQKYRTIALPTSMYNNHNPFPENMVFIAGMRDEVDILSSLQKPKKLTFIGTDGKLYPMMCKPTDDLRLDARMMEFNSIVNMYLQRDPESRDRGLRIRTYSVVPLSDDSGLVEWLPNLYRMRIIIINIYKVMGIDMQSKELRDICCARNDPPEKKRQIFLDVLLPRHPPVLKEWFLKEFPHPTAWYLARTAYVRTTAVMSIIGNTLGLGDRHGENILLDSTCGDVVHVDFNCLFNKGERFDWPERVPFRLTHNMVSAMGPTGVEGMFRHSCEITNRVMRQQIDQLMSVLRPFLYDPLVTWNSEKNTRDENAEMTNEKAMEDIQNIELRLQGILRTPRNKSLSIPLSVEGQVDSLIQEATNVDNLCQMYFGWGPFL